MSSLRVASFNIRNRNFDTEPERQWATVRKPIVAEHIVASGAVLVAIQEGSVVDGGTGQVDDLLDELESQTGKRWEAARYSTVNTFIWDPDAIELLTTPRRTNIGTTGRRAGSALLRDKSTGREFFFVNSHLPINKPDEAAGRAGRKLAVELILATIAPWRDQGVPVVIAADWNDSSTGSGSVDSQLKAAGLVIAKDENTVNGQYNSFNNWDPDLVGRQSGRWIDKIVVTPNVHIAGSGMYLEFASGGTLPLKTPLASDHNLIYADLTFVPQVTTPAPVETVTVETRTGVVTDAYLEAVTGSAEIVVEADVYYGGERVYRGLPIVGGQVSCSRRSIVRRIATLQIDGELREGAWGSRSATPLDPDHPLSHHGQEIRVRHGLRYPDGRIEWVPVGRFRIEGHDNADLLGRGVLTLHALSFEAYIEEARFPKPRTVEGHSAVRIIQDLIREVLPQATFRVGTTNDRRVPKTTFDRERWDAIQSLADSIGAVVYTDGRGTWCIDPAVTTETPSMWVLRGGYGGMLTSGVASASREGVYNEAVVTNDNATTDVKPVYAAVRDDNPKSPTRWGDPDTGAFGKVTTFLEIPTLTTDKQALDAAKALLGRSIGLSHSFTLKGVPLAPMEAGDVVDVVVTTEDPNRPRVFRHIVDEVTLPLGGGADFIVSTRNIGEV